MRQVVQNIRSGATTVDVLPDPVPSATGVVVATVASLVSAGTERYVVELAKKSLLAKARERPDHVRRILQKLRAEGLMTVATQVRAKLAEPMPLGYSAAGIVLECGRSVQEWKPGDRVAVVAPHAEVVSVGRNLVASIPDGVGFAAAAYTAVASIGLQGVRLARVSIGERVLVVGLGLIGQICVALLKAQGCRVYGVDIDSSRLDLARTMGADQVSASADRDAIVAFGHGVGVDATLITAATESNGPIELAADVTRAKGRIVLVGVAGLSIPRPPFFAKELEFTVSSSLGPGRMDPSYEDRGVDYPFGHVRWTAQRNMVAVLEAMADGKLPVDKLTTHTFGIADAPRAYDLVLSREAPSLGIVLTYDGHVPTRRIALPGARGSIPRGSGVSVIGAGNFARLVLLPLLARVAGFRPRGLCTAKGLNAKTTGEAYGFAFATTDVDELLRDAETGSVVIATRHDEHASLVERALRAGKNVFVEKPLCITAEELHALERVVNDLGPACPMLMVGHNRRFARGTALVREHFSRRAPLSVVYRFACPPIPKHAWPQDDREGGGRIIGEACHAIDTVTALVGSLPARVYAESVAMRGGLETSDDRVSIVIRYESGSVGTIHYDASGDAAGPAERIEVFGEGRTAVIDEWDSVELWASGKKTTKRAEKDRGHGAELAAFLERARSGGGWAVPWEELSAVSWASFAAVTSLRTGLPVVREAAACAD